MQAMTAKAQQIQQIKSNKMPYTAKRQQNPEKISILSGVHWQYETNVSQQGGMSWIVIYGSNGGALKP